VIAKLDPYIPVAEAIARLHTPHVEVVIHDLKRDCIHHIVNCFSKRRAGDASLTDTQDIDLTGSMIGPYTKTNWDGRRLRSISTVIRDAKGKAVGLFCINQDIEAFSHVLEQMLALVGPAAPMPAATTLFASDWRERINELVGAFLAKHNLTLAGLKVDDVNALIAALDGAGVFSIRNAMTYVADIIGCSRATLYNRLKLVRSSEKNNATPHA
jgi:D-arginine utilization repressor